jgi:hypothetical protein
VQVFVSESSRSVRRIFRGRGNSTLQDDAKSSSVQGAGDPQDGKRFGGETLEQWFFLSSDCRQISGRGQVAAVSRVIAICVCVAQHSSKMAHVSGGNQREFDLVSAGECSVETARLLMDLCLLRRKLFLFVLSHFSVSGVSVPGVSSSLRRSAANRIP